MDDDWRLGPGGNNPPALPVPKLDDITHHLRAQTQALTDRTVELAFMLEEYLACTSEISSDDELARAGSVAAQAREHIRLIEARREHEKRAWIDGSAAVQKHFATLKDRLAKVADIEALQTAYAEMQPGGQVRVESDYRTLSSLRHNLVIDLIDITQVPAAYLQLNEAAVRRDVFSAKKERRRFSIPGVVLRWVARIQNYTR